jgi:uncharacterized coiled-coil protein SlyX
MSELRSALAEQQKEIKTLGTALRNVSNELELMKAAPRLATTSN